MRKRDLKRENDELHEETLVLHEQLVTLERRLQGAEATSRFWKRMAMEAKALLTLTGTTKISDYP